MPRIQYINKKQIKKTNKKTNKNNKKIIRHQKKKTKIF